MTRKTWKSAILLLAAMNVCAGMVMMSGCKKDDPGAVATGKNEQSMGTEELLGKQGADTEAVSVDPATVAVEVGGVKLTEGEIDGKINRIFMSKGGGNIPQESLAEVKKNLRGHIIDLFITQTLLMNEAVREKIAVGDGEVEQAIGKIKTNVPEGVSFEEMLKKYSITEAKFREDLKRELQIRKLIEKHVKAAPEVTEEEIKTFYDKEISSFVEPESVHARHILVKCEPGTDEAVRAEKKKAAEEYRKQLVKGANFAAIAKEHSDCPSKEKGGELDAFGRGAMIKEFEDAAFSQKTNEVGAVVETKFGYHIIQVLEHTQARTNTLAEVKDQIAAYLTDGKKQQLIAEYLRELKSKAKIKYSQEPTEVGLR